ncbi:SDR family NAD(P)-dependent oxidoreductase [Microlunatus flavus]|uniref:NADP-dependent 3-hydroxy acid dehydrogenase YdfG n=1 Tax=Microlunatus flavus TaxID=1036181 RepID=A0A1H9JJS8_9ACTN|nr:SDR family NAD(P)-dependent oxidoreductase [Microlunatus flavus]SEQ87049.1 NADP-dependent 3-hydroxy acid dehydrogenase YdfG [Microlunatus flavus]
MEHHALPARSVVISGASTGIGRATALRLAADGWHVLAGVRRLADAPDAADGAPGTIRPLRLDVTDPDSVDQATSEIAQATQSSPLTALVNNAGVGLIAPMQDVDLSALQAVLDVNVLGVVRLTQAVVPLLAPGGRIVVVGSIGDRLTMPFGGPLTSSKWAVASIAEAFRLELVSQGIAVTIVEPGSIRSEAVDKVASAAAATARDIARRDPELAERFTRAAAVAIANERHGSDPDVVAAAISRALRARRPRTRVLVGKHARVMATAAAVLPDRTLDRLRLRLFQQPTARLRPAPCSLVDGPSAATPTR